MDTILRKIPSKKYLATTAGILGLILTFAFVFKPSRADQSIETLSGQKIVEGPVRDVQWYLDHEDVYQKAFQECNRNPGKYWQNPNCSNVMAAKKHLFIKGIEKQVR